MTTASHRDPRQRLSHHHLHRNPRQRLSHHHPHRAPLQRHSHYHTPQNFVPPTGGAAQIFTPRHPQTEESPPRAVTPKTILHHTHPCQSPSRGDTESTHTRRYQPPWGSNPPNTRYHLRKTRNPRKPKKSRNSRHPTENPRDPLVTPVPWGSLPSSPQTPWKSSDPTDTTVAKLKPHPHRKRHHPKSPRSTRNPARSDDLPSNSDHHAKGLPATDNR